MSIEKTNTRFVAIEVLTPATIQPGGAIGIALNIIKHVFLIGIGS